MSPTSYQTAPPRISKVADYKDGLQVLQARITENFDKFGTGSKLQIWT